MLPMSNNGVKVNNSANASASATNGRGMATTNTTSSSAAAAAAAVTAATTTTAGVNKHLKGGVASANIKVNNNDGGVPGRTASSGHRRDNSNVALQQQQQQQHAKKDSRLYQYAKPQMHFNAAVMAAELSTGVATTTTTTSSPPPSPSPSPSDSSLAYADGKLVSGTLESLITHMVPTADYYPEYNYVFAFLLSARLFIRPHELLARIAAIWELQQQQHHSAHDVVDEANFSYLSMGGGHTASPLMARKLSLSQCDKDLDAGAVLAHQHQLQQQQQQQHQQLGQKTLRNTIQRSAQNCIRLLSEWIETFPYDFRDERLMQQVRILARKCVYIDNALGKHVSRILQMLVQRLTALEKYEEFLQSLLAADLNGGAAAQHYGTSASASYSSSSGSSSSTSVAPNAVAMAASSLTGSVAAAAAAASGGHSNSLGKTGTASHNAAAAAAAAVELISDLNSHDVYGVMDICGNCAQMAHQLTAIELERLSHIGPEEFVQAFAKEYHNSIANKANSSNSGASSTIPTTMAAASSPAPGSATSAGCVSAMNSSSLNDMKKTRNLESYVEWFNRLSYLTASEIVKYPKKKQRVRVIEFWIETARECFNIGNFNSLMAIIAGLNLAPISRLKKTWSKVQSAKFSVLEHQMDPTSNFNSYRSTLKAAMWRSEGATDERERIIIPFFSLFVKDLYFLNEGCSNRLPNNHINFEKCSQLAKQIMEFNEWKKVSCPYEKLPNVIAFLQNSPVLNENTLSMASFECETPENTEEKDRYKTVKAETKQLLQQKQQVLQLLQQQQH